MQIAEETDRPSIRPNRHEHARFGRFCHSLGLYGFAFFVNSLEVTAVEHHIVLIFAGQHGVRLSSGSDQDARAGKVTVSTGRDSAFPVSASNRKLRKRDRSAWP